MQPRQQQLRCDRADEREEHVPLRIPDIALRTEESLRVTAADDRRHPVRSTAVGFVKLAPDIHVGGKVAKGALVATVDVLGVAVEVRADHGGIVAKLRCASGDPVEYGQELFLVESVGEVKA